MIAIATIIENHGFEFGKEKFFGKGNFNPIILAERVIYHLYYFWESSSFEVIADGCFAIPSLLYTRIWSNPLFLSIRFTEFQIWNL